MRSQNDPNFMPPNPLHNPFVKGKNAQTPQPKSNPSPKQTSPQVKPQERGLGDILFSPIAGIARSIAWVTDPSGGLKYVLYAGAIGCFGLSVESLYAVMPRTDGLTATEVRFIPKPGVEDGADAARIIPNPLALMRTATDAILGWIPFYTKIANGSPMSGFCVWLDLNFYGAIALSALIQGIEAKVLRRMTIELRKARLDRVKHHKVEDLSPKALAIARVRALEYQNSGMGSYVFSAVMILGTYSVEIGSFFMSLGSTGASTPVLLIYGFLTVFGFESFWNMATPPEEA